MTNDKLQNCILQKNVDALWRTYTQLPYYIQMQRDQSEMLLSQTPHDPDPTILVGVTRGGVKLSPRLTLTNKTTSQ